MRSVSFACASLRERTIALTIAIAVTRTNGIAVHVISRPVCPWIGGPSSKSSSCGPEVEDRVDHHRGDDREDHDADRDHEPEDEVDATGLARGVLRQPGRHERDGSGDTARDQLPIPKSATMEPLRIRVGA